MKFPGAVWAVVPVAVGILSSMGSVRALADPVPAWAAPATVYEQVRTPEDAPAPPSAGQPSLPAAAAATAPAATPANSVIDAVRAKLADKSRRASADQLEALTAFYASRAEALWVKDGQLNDKAAAAIGEIGKAAAYGLDPSAFVLPALASAPSIDADAETELQVSVAILKYADHARGGRVDPLALSNILDMKPPLKDPRAVLAEISNDGSPDAYLRGLHPKHTGFQQLKAALATARGPQVEEKIDEALLIKLPEGKAVKTIKPGEEGEDIVLLRKRLKIDAQSPDNDRLYDARLEAAVKEFQAASGLKVNGQLNAKTRTALNRQGEPKKADPKRDVDRIIVNMERWRWLPEDLGAFYVINNVPEFMSRVVKNDAELLKQKMIVGQPTWPTPILSSKMEFVIFQPDWGVPDGIKVKELLPRLKRASGGDNFFDSFFGGGSSGGARVLAAYKLNPSLNGRPVDANAINWNSVDIRRFSFIQPAGAENPLGLVKFRFPNRHDVYMHDTPQRGLFAQSFRALSHGCMRLDQPRKLAELILAEDKGWSSDKVGAMFQAGGDVTLTKPVSVYLTYFTARVSEDGKVEKYPDIYGHDERLMSALQGRAVRYNAPEQNDAVSAIDDGYDAPQATQKKKVAGKQRREPQSAGNILSDALNGLLAN